MEHIHTFKCIYIKNIWFGVQHRSSTIKRGSSSCCCRRRNKLTNMVQDDVGVRDCTRSPSDAGHYQLSASAVACDAAATSAGVSAVGVGVVEPAAAAIAADSASAADDVD